MDEVKIKCWNCRRWSTVIFQDLKTIVDGWTCSCGAGIDRSKQQIVINEKGIFIIPKRIEKHGENKGKMSAVQQSV